MGEMEGVESGDPHMRMDLRSKVYKLIFTDTDRVDRAFDMGLSVVIVASVLAVMLESVGGINARYEVFLFRLEWFFTAIFTVEYALRLWCHGRPLRYALSFFGIIDLIAVLPTYFMWLLPGSQTLVVVRLLRILRVFRVFKLAHFVEDAPLFAKALKKAGGRMTIFLSGVLVLVTIFGSLMYLIEGHENGFDSIPRSVYWAIVTLTTVGYGDISPQTALGQGLAAVIMIVGYAIIAVAAGLVLTEFARAQEMQHGRRCGRCKEQKHEEKAEYCKRCGNKLPSKAV